MTDSQHKQTRASMLCVIAFTIGTVVAFASGCSAGFQTKAEWSNYTQPHFELVRIYENN
tara:strand:- start:70 stop:246 length:177 start_codon:yes stop_codon:yes gene_type:complete